MAMHGKHLQHRYPTLELYVIIIIIIARMTVACTV